MPRLLGHEDIVKNLSTLAKKDELSHGYIFYGPSMVGKRTLALAFAHFLEKGSFEIPGDTEVLQDMKVVDLAFAKLLDPDKKDSVSIDAVREIKNFLWRKPNVSARRVLVLDDAEFLTNEAQNALLKLTEEPPASSLIIIITADLDALLPTISSRLQRIYLGAVAEKKLAQWLAAKAEAGGRGLTAAKAGSFAKQALGKPGLAVRLSNDEVFNEGIAQAKAFLKVAPAARKDFIKALIEPEDFNLRIFLDALLVALSWEMEKTNRAKTALWHKTLALYGRNMNFGLNPRLQLAALLAAE